MFLRIYIPPCVYPPVTMALLMYVPPCVRPRVCMSHRVYDSPSRRIVILCSALWVDMLIGRCSLVAVVSSVLFGRCGLVGVV